MPWALGTIDRGFLKTVCKEQTTVQNLLSDLVSEQINFKIEKHE